MDVIVTIKLNEAVRFLYDPSEIEQQVRSHIKKMIAGNNQLSMGVKDYFVEVRE